MADQRVSDYVASGLIANRPATPDPPTGGSSFYYATDESILYVWDIVAGAWDEVGGGSGGGGWSLESTNTATTQAELDVPLPAADFLKLECIFIPVTDSVLLNGRVTTDNFTSVESGASDYEWNAARYRGGATNQSSDLSDSEMTFNQNGMGNDADGAYRFTLYCRGHSNAALLTCFDGKGVVRDTGAGFGQMFIMGNYIGATTVVDGIRFFFSSGNISSATVRVYSPVTT